MQERNDIAKVLRKLRIEHELTQDDVATVLGIQRTTYTKYEKDHKAEISVLVRLADFYSISLDEMVSPLRKKISGQSMTVCSPRKGEEKLELWEPESLSKDEKRLLMFFRCSKRKRLILEEVRKIVAEDRMTDD